MRQVQHKDSEEAEQKAKEVEPEPMKEAETNPLIEVQVFNDSDVTKAPRTPASNSKSTQCLLGIVGYQILALVIKF